MSRPQWAPIQIDTNQPSASRVYDYYLGGSHNFAVDREFAQRVLQQTPGLPLVLQANRAFLRRAVRYYMEQGITQLLDLGSGIPTVGNVHEVAQAINPDVSVVYVDSDPVAVAHSDAILANNHNATIIQADMRDPRVIFEHTEFDRLIDLNQPVGILVAGVFHFIPDSQRPTDTVKALYDAVAPGSYLAIAQASGDFAPEYIERVVPLYAQTPDPMTFRSHAEILALFGDFTLVEPGLVQIPLWRPEPDAELDEWSENYPGYAGIGQKAAAKDGRD